MRRAIRNRMALDLAWKLTLKRCRLIRMFGGVKSTYACEVLRNLGARVDRLNNFARAQS